MCIHMMDEGDVSHLSCWGCGGWMEVTEKRSQEGGL